MALNGNFVRGPIPATKSGDVWFVELPMTEGTYTWLWQPSDGSVGRGSALAPDSLLTGLQIVRPLQRITNAYPGR
jgi:hypothetical protein